MPPILTHGGVIRDYIAGEDIRNNDIYIIDTETQQIRKPENPSEWFCCQVVYVYETNPWGIEGVEDFLSQEMINHSMIRKGKRCRCWLGSFRV